ncbi:MAG TPA: ASCH domain-containing protein [Nitrososphaeraceae archaeon]|jgi:predicted transcriptional regulator|nr:ASCH domain-containing protein [Nitrososphaeraceae archaeon]
MKCLSLKQPYADLLAFGEKTIELRKWNTKFRGEFLIHASKNIDLQACERLDIDIDKLTTGAIIGSAFLYDVKVYSNQEDFNRENQKHFSIISKYFDGYKYGFLIRNARMFKKSVPYPGKLRFFEVDNSIKF